MTTIHITPTYLSNLTPIRGIAALLTVIFHVDLALTLLVASLTYRFIEVPARHVLNARFRKSTAPFSGASGQIAT